MEQVKVILIKIQAVAGRMGLLTVIFLFILFFHPTSVQARQDVSFNTSFDYSPDIQEMFRKINLVSPSSFAANNVLPKVKASSEAVVFTSTIAARKSTGHTFVVTTKFLRRSSTIDKYVEIIQGEEPDDMVHMRVALDNQGQAFKQTLLDIKGVPVQVYDRPQDIFAYMQSAGRDGKIELKEWMYARQPNCLQGTCLRWFIKGDDFNRRLIFDVNQQGKVDIQRQMVIAGTGPMDYQKQRHVIEAVKKVLKNMNVHIAGEDVVGGVQPVYYWTKEGVPKIGRMRLAGKEVLDVLINESPEAYPLLIDPALMFEER